MPTASRANQKPPPLPYASPLDHIGDDIDSLLDHCDKVQSRWDQCLDSAGLCKENVSERGRNCTKKGRNKVRHGHQSNEAASAHQDALSASSNAQDHDMSPNGDCQLWTTAGREISTALQEARNMLKNAKECVGEAANVEENTAKSPVSSPEDVKPSTVHHPQVPSVSEDLPLQTAAGLEVAEALNQARDKLEDAKNWASRTPVAENAANAHPAQKLDLQSPAHLASGNQLPSSKSKRVVRAPSLSSPSSQKNIDQSRARLECFRRRLMEEDAAPSSISSLSPCYRPGQLHSQSRSSKKLISPKCKDDTQSPERHGAAASSPHRGVRHSMILKEPGFSGKNGSACTPSSGSCQQPQSCKASRACPADDDPCQFEVNSSPHNARGSDSLLTRNGRKRWKVVGGVDKGGLIVRAGHELGSVALPERLSNGALVEEEELVGDRLSYIRISGFGPSKGWVSIKLRGKDLLIPADECAHECEQVGSTSSPSQNPNFSARCRQRDSETPCSEKFPVKNPSKKRAHSVQALLESRDSTAAHSIQHPDKLHKREDHRVRRALREHDGDGHDNAPRDIKCKGPTSISLPRIHASHSAPPPRQKAHKVEECRLPPIPGIRA